MLKLFNNMKMFTKMPGVLSKEKVSIAKNNRTSKKLNTQKIVFSSLVLIPKYREPILFLLNDKYKPYLCFLKVLWM